MNITRNICISDGTFNLIKEWTRLDDACDCLLNNDKSYREMRICQTEIGNEILYAISTELRDNNIKISNLDLHDKAS